MTNTDHASRILNSITRRQFLAAGVGAPLLLGMTRKARGLILPGGASSGGSLPDLSWSATVTGSAKSAAAGFIAPVAFNGAAFNGASSEQGARIYPVGAAQTIDVYYERILGETGSISATISIFASLNTVSGTHFTPVSQTLTWADGEIGWKKASIPILAIPASFGLVGITCSGSYAYRPTSWIWLQGGIRDANAKYLVTSNGTNVYGNASGAGTLANPWQSLAYACSQMGASGGILYVQNAGTHVEWTGTAGSGTGPIINNACSNSSPLVILPDPQGSGTPTIDNGSTAGGSAIVYSNAPIGLNLDSSGSSIWVCGLHIYRGNFSFQNSTQYTDCVVWQCEVDSVSGSGSNTHCVRFDNTKYFIAQDCYLHESYTIEQGTSNGYTSVASGMESNAGGFYSAGASFAHCRGKWGQAFVIHKQASNTSTDTSPDVTHCLGEQMQAKTSGGGNFILYPVQGNGYHNGIVRYSVYQGANDTSVGPAGGFIYGPGSATSESDHLDVLNCVCISLHGGGLIEFGDATNVRIFNTISQNSASGYDEIIVSNPDSGRSSQLEIADYNLYVNGSHTYITGYGGSSTTYGSLAAWQAASPGSYLEYSPDGHSGSTSTIPPYANVSSYNFRLNGSSGRGGRPIGVGAEGVGIANNFLNSSLPVTA